MTELPPNKGATQNSNTNAKSTSKQADTDPGTQEAGTDGSRPIQIQRRRVWRACESCRRKKIKCDGNEPTCSQCLATKSQCTWLQTKDRAALSRHYVQELEARLLHMESLFTQLGHNIPPLLNPNTPNESSSSSVPRKPVVAVATAVTAQSPASPASPAVSSPSDSQPRIKMEELDDDVALQFSQLALDEHGHLRWIGGSSTMTLIQSFRQSTAAPPMHRVSPFDEESGVQGRQLYFPAAVFTGKVRALPGAEEAEFPDRDLADKMVEMYFAKLHALMPVLDKATFLTQYAALMDSTTRMDLDPAFMSLVFAVFACTARLVDDPRHRTDGSLDEGGMGMVYYERAMILLYISHASTQVAHVQINVLMAAYLCSVNCLPQAWLLVGQALRIGQDLGLHRSTKWVPHANERQTRRKVWACVYILDRMLAIALGRPLGIYDSDCDAEQPADVDDDNLDAYFNGAEIDRSNASLMSGFNYLFSLYQIAGQVLQRVYALDKCRESLDAEHKAELLSAVRDLDAKLTVWSESVPLAFRTNPTPEQAPMAVVLCNHWYSVLTTLHRKLLPVPGAAGVGAADENGRPIAPESVAKAVWSAQSTIKLHSSVKANVPPSYHLAFFIQSLFSSAVIILLYAMHTRDAAAKEWFNDTEAVVPALVAWEGIWPGARKCKELLIELIRTTRIAIAQRGIIAMEVPQHARTGSGQFQGSPTLAHERPNPRFQKARTGRSKKAAASMSPSRQRGHPYKSMAAMLPPPHKRTRHESQDLGQPPATSSSFQHNTFDATSSEDLLSRRRNSLSAGVPSPPRPNPNMPSFAPSGSRLSFDGVHSTPSPDIGTPLSPYDHSNSQQALGGPELWMDTSHERSPMLDMNDNSGSFEFSHQPIAEADPYFMGSGFGSGNSGDLSGEYPSADFGLASSSHPEDTFSASGLPFPALDFLRNFSTNDQQSYDPNAFDWNKFDSNAFQYNGNDVPFSLNESLFEPSPVTSSQSNPNANQAHSPTT